MQLDRNHPMTVSYDVAPDATHTGPPGRHPGTMNRTRSVAEPAGRREVLNPLQRRVMDDHLLGPRLRSHPVQQHPEVWVQAARELLHRCHHDRAKQLLETVIHTHPEHIEARLGLVVACLHGSPATWPEGLHAARATRALTDSQALTPEQQTDCYIALGLALGAVARTPVMAQSARSRFRSEARQVLETALQQDAGGGMRAAQARYLKAVVNAEGGHYDQAVADAEQALEAAGQDPGPMWAATLVLLALLLSARQQPQAALQVVDSGLSAPSALLTGSIGVASSSSSSSAAAQAPGGAPAGHNGPSAATCSSWGSCLHSALSLDALLLRVKAHLLLACADANAALSALGAARKRLVARRKGLGPGEAALAQAFKQQEAQVWRELALVYVGQSQVADAQLCIQHAQGLDPHSADTFHAAGCVAEAAGDQAAAEEALQTALAVDPAHPPSLLSKGTLLRKRGGAADLAVAGSVLMDALRYQPQSHVGWHNLGLVRQEQGLASEAEKHLFTAVTLGAAAPVLSYSTLPLIA